MSTVSHHRTSKLETYSLNFPYTEESTPPGDMKGTLEMLQGVLVTVENLKGQPLYGHHKITIA